MYSKTHNPDQFTKNGVSPETPTLTPSTMTEPLESLRVPRVSRRKRQKTERAANVPGDASLETTAKRRLKRGGKIGRLAMLMDMPMDILFEIFGHLRPLDILNLARTTKGFRDILMHRSSISVWKAARSNVPGFPDCPPEMSEPQWAHLAFYPFCNFCLTPNIKNVDWRLRVRLCSKCTKQHIAESHEWGWTPTDYRSMVPVRPGSRTRVAYLRENYVAMVKQYEEIKDVAEQEAFLENRGKTLQEMARHASRCEKWASRLAQNRSQELQDIKSTRKKVIVERLTALGWGEEIEQIPYSDNLGNHRLVKAPHALTDRIWNNIRLPLISYMEEMKKKRLAREFKALVLVRKRIAVNVLRNYKISQLPFTSVMPESADFCLFPAIKEIIEQPAEVEVDETSFKDLLPLLPGIFDEWRTGINKKLVDKLRKEEEEEGNLRFSSSLSTALVGGSSQRNTSSSSAIENKLQLATTVFKCRRCIIPSSLSDDYDFYPSGFDDRWSDEDEDEDFFDYNMDDFPFGGIFCVKTKFPDPLFYPNVFGHRCLTKASGYSYYGDVMDHTDGYRSPLSCDFLELDKETGKFIRDIVVVAGLDPLAATPADMDRADAKFACLACASPDHASDESSWVGTFGWRAAINHRNKCRFSTKGHHLNSSWRWYKLDEVQSAEADEEAAHDDPSNEREDWLCMYCHDLPSETSPLTLERVKNHLEISHDVTLPMCNRDYTKTFESPQIPPTTKPFHSAFMYLQLPH